MNTKVLPESLIKAESSKYSAVIIQLCTLGQNKTKPKSKKGSDFHTRRTFGSAEMAPAAKLEQL